MCENIGAPTNRSYTAPTPLLHRSYSSYKNPSVAAAAQLFQLMAELARAIQWYEQGPLTASEFQAARRAVAGCRVEDAPAQQLHGVSGVRKQTDPTVPSHHTQRWCQRAPPRAAPSHPTQHWCQRAPPQAMLGGDLRMLPMSASAFFAAGGLPGHGCLVVQHCKKGIGGL